MVQMHGIEYKAIAKDDLELPDNSHEHWIKGNSYTLIYGEFIVLQAKVDLGHIILKKALMALKIYLILHQ